MKQIVIYLAIIASCSAQFPLSSTENPVWKGPFADHVIGRLVSDTPEVLEAKRQHEQAYAQARAILPELPPEVRYQETPTLQHGVQPNLVPQIPYVPQPVVPQQRVFPPQPIIPQQPFVQHPFLQTQLGEETPRWTGPIADHMIGQLVSDTPEVAEAKRQHLDAVSQVRSVLPTLPAVEERNLNQPIIVHPSIVQQPLLRHPGLEHLEQGQMLPQFTMFAEEIPRSPIGEVPEVHAARQAHLAAYKAVRSQLPELKDVQPVSSTPQSVAYSRF